MNLGIDPAQDLYEQQDVDSQIVHKLIAEYLIHNCYTETLLEFQIQKSKDYDLSKRKELRSLVLNG